MLKPIFLSGVLILTAIAAHCQPATVALTAKSVFKTPYVAAEADPAKNISPSMLVSPSFYTAHLPFFCRQEINIERITKFPVKFRLGSVQYVDYLEGKVNATRPF
jgi:hypothetical protein